MPAASQIASNAFAPLQQAWSEVYAGASSPAGQSVLWQTATTPVMIGASMAAPTAIPLAANFAQREYNRAVLGYWNQFKMPLLLGGAALLIGAVASKSRVLGVAGVLALGGYAYGRYTYER